MASYDRSCDVYQGFNFRKDKVSTVGFLTALTIGTVELKADITAKDPQDPSKDLAVVSVLSSVSWAVGVTDGVYLSGQLSTANRQAVQQLLYTDLSNVLVEKVFTVYEYDPVAKKYYKGLHSEGTTLKGLLEKTGGDV